jgi:hypothetical protein
MSERSLTDAIAAVVELYFGYTIHSTNCALDILDVRELQGLLALRQAVPELLENMDRLVLYITSAGVEGGPYTDMLADLLAASQRLRAVMEQEG